MDIHIIHTHTSYIHYTTDLLQEERDEVKVVVGCCQVESSVPLSVSLGDHLRSVAPYELLHATERREHKTQFPK